MAMTKNHTDNIDSATLCNIETNSAFVKQFMSDCDIFIVIRKTVIAMTLLWNWAEGFSDFVT